MKAPNPRGELFADAFQVGKETSRATQAALFRMRLFVSLLRQRPILISTRHEAGIVVDPRPTEPRSRGMGPTDSLELDDEINGTGSGLGGLINIDA